jgi:hypothetical protein
MYLQWVIASHLQRTFADYLKCQMCGLRLLVVIPLMMDLCMIFVMDHPMFNRNPRALQIILNTDDLEIVNPLHNKKHKITVFYFSLANISPAFRSQLHVMQLMAIAKTSDILKHAAQEKLLADFIAVVNKLSSGGLRTQINGNYHVIEGGLVCVPADTLAAHNLGKFKEGVAFANKGCRQYECKTKETRGVFFSADCVKRSLKIHKERCELLEEPLSKKAGQYWSRDWGINGTSCLLQLDFNFITGLVQDPMHVLLEGVVPRELSLLLYKVVCVFKFCTESSLNAAIAGFPFSYLHAKSKPQPIEKGNDENVMSVRQTASATLTLCYFLPLLLAPSVDRGNPYWMNWLRLLKIVILSTSAYCSRETADLLCIIIAEYLQECQRLYPRASFIPKMHYLIHLPDQMLQYGPLRHHWCMRFEGKNGFLKSKKWRNFRNVPYSLAKYHQLHMLYRQRGKNGESMLNFLYTRDTVQNGEEFVLCD